MRFSELGFDYSNLSSCTIKKKSYLAAIISFFIGITFLIIFVVFLITYLAEVPMHINNRTIYFGDPEYEQFYMIFLGVMGTISFVVILLILVSIFSKPKPYIIMDSNVDTEVFYYIYNRVKAEEIYLTSDRAIVKNKRFNNVYTETNKDIINKIFNKYIFWRQLAAVEDYKIKIKSNSTVLKFKEKVNAFFSYLKSYKFSNDINVVPTKVKETVTVRAGGNFRIQHMCTYYFEDVNRNQYLDIDPDIKKTLNNNY